MFDNFLIHTFHDGNCLQAYKIFGAHFETHEGKKGVRFTTYAPNARSAQVVGEFDQWGETPCYMEKYNNGGIYTVFVEGVKEFDMYKFKFETPQGDMIEKADADYYKMILMDIQMPVMNGYDATLTIRKMKDTKKARIPIIAMTANAFAEDTQKALSVGMNAHVAKPVDMNILVPTMMKYL